MAVTVARNPYLHAEPFYIDMEQRGLQLVDMVPSALGAAAERGEVDAGPLPLAHWLRLADRFQPVAGFCIASADRFGSILLYAKRPIQELAGSRIGVSGQATTAFRLLQMVLSLRYGVQPQAYVTLQEPNDALFLIGNEALRRRRGVRGYPHRYDLGQEWQQWTGLPLVIARWAARKDLDPKYIEAMEAALYIGLEDGVDALYHQSEPREDLLMLPRDVVDYIQGFRYYVGVAEQQAINRFAQYLGQIDLAAAPGQAPP